VRTQPVDCEGAPRDIGFDQGRACAGALRARLGSNGCWDRLRLRAGWSDPHDARVARDLRRHFPHQAEWLAGMARGAGVPLAWLERELSSDALSPSPDALAVAATSEVSDNTDSKAEGRAARRSRAESEREAEGRAVRRSRAESSSKAGGLLARTAARGAIVRRSHPEGGLGSLELALPWLSAPLAGVNEAGLALAAVPGPFEEGGCAAPASLLVQDCLQRFEGLEAVLDWCLGRPAAGSATLLLADASGEVAGVEFAGGERRVLRPAAGFLFATGGDVAESQLARRLREAAPLGPADLAVALAAGETASARLARTEGLVGIDPAGRRLGLFGEIRPGQAPAAHWMDV
jgi:hypothetical protein